MDSAACRSVLPMISTNVSDSPRAALPLASELQDAVDGAIGMTIPPPHFSRSAMVHCHIFKKINASSAPMPANEEDETCFVTFDGLDG